MLGSRFSARRGRRRAARRSLAVGLGLGLVLAGGCGGDGGDGRRSTDVGSATSARRGEATDAPANSSGGAPAPSSLLTFSASAIGGGRVEASTYQGRPVLLWFWSPW